jgi:hypothetical protein
LYQNAQTDSIHALIPVRVPFSCPNMPPQAGRDRQIIIEEKEGKKKWGNSSGI